MTNIQITEKRISDAELSARLEELTQKSRVCSIFGVALIIAPIVVMTLWRQISFLEPIARLISFRQDDPFYANMIAGLVSMLAFFPALYSFVRGSIHRNTKKQLISVNITRDILENSFELLEYNPDDGIPSELLRESNLSKKVMVNRTSDYIRGRHKGVNFQFSDVKLTVPIGRSDKTVFTGQWLIVDLDKEINPAVTISNRGNRLMIDRTSTVEMENVKFNRDYIVSAADRHMAFYVVTPKMMEFIQSMGRTVFGKQHICFVKNHLHIAVDTEIDSFEPCKDSKDLDALRKRIENETNFIKWAIDHLLHDERLFNIKKGEST